VEGNITFLCGSLCGDQDDGWWGSDWCGLGDGETEAVIHLLYGIATRGDKGRLARVVTLQDEHPAQVIVEARPRPLNKATEPLCELYFFLGELVYFRIALVDLLRDLLVFGAEWCGGTAAQGMSNVPGCFFRDLL
jgi:hypothetical protein